MKTILTLQALLFTQLGFAQINQTTTLNYFYISLSSEIYQTLAPNGTFENILGEVAGDINTGLSDAVTDMPTSGDLRGDHLRDIFYDGLEKMTYKIFENELKIALEPKDKLAGKINYFGSYPHTLKFKKALKKAPGEDFYMTYHVEMYKGGMGISPMGIEIGGKIKPITIIKLKIADSKGKTIQDFEIKEKTDIVVGSTHTSVGVIDMSSGESPEEVCAKLLQIYQNALNVLVEEFQKKNKKAYKNS